MITDDAAYRGEVAIAPRRVADAVASTQGEYPRLIHLGEKLENDLHRWLDSELHEHFMERGPVLEDWKRYQTLYWAEPLNKEKNFPFKRAANIVVPLAAIAVGAIHYRMMNTLFAVEPFWALRPRSKEWQGATAPVQEFLQAKCESHEDLKLYEFVNISSLECIKLGVGVAKSGFDKILKKSIRSTGDSEQEFFVVEREGATLERVPVNNYLMRLNELDPQIAGWCGEHHKFSWSRMKKYAQSGRFDVEVLESIKAHWRGIHFPQDMGDGVDYQQHVEGLANAEPGDVEVFDVYEIWCSFDVDEDGYDEEIVVDYHRDSGKFLSIRYNWYDDLHRPYRIGNLIPVEGVWTGIGICKLSEQFQNEVTTIRRQRLDNATLANMSMVAIKKGVGYGPGEPVFPGKMWFFDDPTKDIVPVKLNEIYPSSFNNEQMVTRDWEKITNVNDSVLGLPQAVGNTTATGDLARIDQGSKGFEYFLKQFKRWYSVLGMDVISNYQNFGTRDQSYWITGDDGATVEKFFQLPTYMVRKGALVDLTVTDSITNRETEQQKWLQLFQVLTNYYDRVLQLSQVIVQFTGDPTPILLLAQRAMAASAEAGKRLMETFGEPDADRFSLVEDNPNGDQTGIELTGLAGLFGGGIGGAGLLPPGNGIAQQPVQNGSGGTSQNGSQSRLGNFSQTNGRT